jgi:phosphatidyl-myo-inositol dimannoside synthase
MFHGALYGPELWEMYAQSSLLVLPSRESADDVEGFGTVFIEAGSFGVPSVGTRTGGIPEAIVDRMTGLLVESENVGQLKDAIKRLLSDPDYLARLGRAAKARASEFTWDSSLNQVLQVFGGTN